MVPMFYIETALNIPNWSLIDYFTSILQKTLAFFCVKTIDLVLIDQSVGKRSLHQIDTVNAKKRWSTIYWRVNILL
jgi:hypothetical protein